VPETIIITVNLVGKDSLPSGISYLGREQRSPNFFRELRNRFRVDMIPKRAGKSEKFTVGRLHWKLSEQSETNYFPTVLLDLEDSNVFSSDIGKIILNSIRSK